MAKEIDDLLNDLFGKSGSPRQMRSVPASGNKTPASTPADVINSVDNAGNALNETLQRQLDELKKMTSELDMSSIEREVERDFGVAAKASGSSPSKRAGIEGFDRLISELNREIIGQDVFLQQLIIAYKRPFVAGFTEGAAKNTIFISGKRASGRHSAVYMITKQLHERGVFTSPDVQRLNLATYPTQSDERVFLQDLYMALNGAGETVIFDNFEKCHPAFLTQLSDLVIHGKLRLSNRYVLQNGRLIDAGNALTADIIGSIAANGKYLVFISEGGRDKLADSFGAPFVTAVGDVCGTAPLIQQYIDEIAAAKLNSLEKRTAEKLNIALTRGEGVAALAASHYSAQNGVQGIIDFFDDAYSALAQYVLESDVRSAKGELYAENRRLMVRIEGVSDPLDLMTLLPGEYMGELEAVKAEMAGVIGLTEIKEYIFSLENHYKVQAMRKAQGMKTAPVSMHMVFTGNPGTGKTTIARLISKYLKAIGVLSGGQLIEVTRADLVGKYVGHTAPLTTQVTKSAIGGVLFIDEAYSLYRGEQDSFGLESIDTLVKGIEDNRDNLIVILAGYTNEMELFMTSNSGLRSRFPNIIEFPDYSGDELQQIAILQAAGKGYELDEGAKNNLLDYFNVIQAMDSRDSGNGRLARNVIERAILAQSKRMAEKPGELNLLTAVDFDLFE